MGILRGNARLLFQEASQRPFHGSLLQLSRCLVFLTAEEVRTLARRHGIELREPREIRLSHNPRLAAHGCLDDRTLFEMLGFDEVHSLDISDYEGATHIADLNQPLPESLAGRYDAVLDAGTLQHVFHLPQALQNMHTALRPGGRFLIGMAAAHNHIDHGFYEFSPTLFHDYLSTNGYQIDSLRLGEFHHAWLDGRLHTTTWAIYDYQPGMLDAYSYGGFGRRQVCVFVAATRLPGATGDVIPQQSYYQRVWTDTERALDWQEPPPSLQRRLRGRFEHHLAVAARAHPRLLRLLIAGKSLRRRLSGSRRPPISAHY